MNDGYEVTVYLEENDSRQLLSLSTWYQGTDLIQFNNCLHDLLEDLKNLKDHHVISAIMKEVKK